MHDAHKIKVFAAVAQSLSFTRAAQTLHLTQSAASHAVVSLEHSRKIFASFEEAEAAVKRAARPDRGFLRIGASPAACQYLVPESLREFRESYPDFELSIAVGDSPQIARLLHDGAIDL